MRKIIVSFRLKELLIGILVFNLCIIFFSVIIGGRTKNIGRNIANKKYEKKDVSLKKNENKNNKVNILHNKIDPKIKIYLTKENRVITLDLEDYVTGVVSAEMPANFGAEALKAQSIAARTYAVAHMKKLIGGGCNLCKEADLCDSIHCQAYIDKQKRLASWPKSQREELYNKVKNAVISTKGEVLSYNDELVMSPFYFAISSGKTENAEEVFSNTVPYLKSVESRGEEIAPKFKKDFIFTRKEFINRMSSKYNNININEGNLKDRICILERSEAGSVKKIKIGNITTDGRVVRSLMKLTSSNFDITYEGDNIIFKCRGYGHGVGMSQWGASAMAKEGKNYKEILSHYYKGIKISKLKYLK